jgi:hypothetical protein
LQAGGHRFDPGWLHGGSGCKAPCYCGAVVGSLASPFVRQSKTSAKHTMRSLVRLWDRHERGRFRARTQRRLRIVKPQGGWPVLRGLRGRVAWRGYTPVRRRSRRACRRALLTPSRQSLSGLCRRLRFWTASPGGYSVARDAWSCVSGPP